MSGAMKSVDGGHGARRGRERRTMGEGKRERQTTLATGIISAAGSAALVACVLGAVGLQQTHSSAEQLESLKSEALVVQQAVQNVAEKHETEALKSLSAMIAPTLADAYEAQQDAAAASVKEKAPGAQSVSIACAAPATALPL